MAVRDQPRRLLASSRPRRPGAYGAEACVASCARSVTHLRNALPRVLVVSLAPAADVAKYAADLGRGTSLAMAKTTRVVMPQLGESVHEGTISRWLVKPGDKVVEFEPLLEV